MNLAPVKIFLFDVLYYASLLLVVLAVDSAIILLILYLAFGFTI